MKTWLILLAVLAGGCGDDEEPDPLATASGFCTEWAKGACSENVQNNCSSTTPDDCILAQTDFCQTLVPASLYSKANAQACLDAVKEAYVDAQLTGEERDVVRYLAAPCDLVLSGDGQEDDQCDEDADCAREAGLECVHKLGEPLGTCQVPDVVGGGLTCNEANQVCAEGFYCEEEGNCLARKNVDDECTATVPCAKGLKCEMEPEAGVGVCVAKLKRGEEGCEVDDDCATGICAAGEGDNLNLCASVILLDTPKAICRDFR